MDKEKISVIIPVYNRQDYLEKSLNSLLDQDGVSTEILLIDDGSTDNTGKICDDYAKKHLNIRVFHITHSGASFARNLGLDNATGDYIAFLDSDDVMEKDCLKSLLTALKKNDADYCIGNYAQYSEDGTFVDSPRLGPDYSNKLIDPKKALGIINSVNSFLLFVLWGKLYKKEIWEGIRLPDIPISEDMCIIPSIMEKEPKIFVLDKVVYRQTLSGNSLARSALDYKVLYASDSVLKITDYLLEKDCNDLALYTFGSGTRRLLNARSLLKDSASKAEITRQYRKYRETALVLLPKVNMNSKLRLRLFRTNLSLYNLVRKLIKENK